MPKPKFKLEPFLFITLPFIFGIILYKHNILICGIVVFALLSIKISKLLPLTVMIFASLGFLLAQNHTNISMLHYDTPQLYIAKIDTPISSHNKRYNQYEASILHFKGKKWHHSNNKVLLNIDTSQTVKIADVIVYKSKTYNIDNPYNTYYNRKNIFGRQYAYSITTIDSIKNSFTQNITKLRFKTAQRITALDTTKSQATAIMQALTTGVKTEIDKQTKQNYQLSGTAHLLAISGLHVGIIFALLNLLIKPIYLIKNSHTIKLLIVLSLMWLFAIFSGFTPSVIRATIMFSLLQIALHSGRRSSSLNILLASAFIILICNTNILYDIGFQLSYIAMIGIITIYKPLRQLLKPKNKALKIIWSLIVVTIAAQITTTPIVIYYFGYVSILGVMSNILLWAFTPMIIATTMVFIITDINIIGTIAIYITEAQNKIVEWISSFKWGVYNIDTFTFMELLITYSIITLLIISTMFFNCFFVRRNTKNHPYTTSYIKCR